MKKIISFIIILSMVLSQTVSFAQMNDKRLEYSFVDGTMYIMGKGDLPDYGQNYGVDTSPVSFRNSKRIVVHEGVESIGAFTFRFCGAESVSLPSTLKKIGKCAFYGCENLKEINLPEGLTEIDNMAFMDCHSLEKIVIPESVTTLFGAVFMNCDNLKSLTIPDSVKYINSGLFSYCESLEVLEIGKNARGDKLDFGGVENIKEIRVHPDNPSFKVVDNILFNKDMTYLIKYPKQTQGEYVVPKSVTEVGMFAFSGCENMTITIPEGIGKTALRVDDTVRLQSDTINSKYTKLEFADDVFYYTENAVNYYYGGKELTIHKITDNGDKMVTFPESFTDYSIVNIDKTVCIQDGIEKVDARHLDYIPRGTFSLTKIKEVILSPNLKIIDVGAFSGCTELKSITLPEGLEKIENGAFSRSGIESITIPSTVTFIGHNAFESVGSLKKIVIKEGNLKTFGSDSGFGGFTLESFNGLSYNVEVYLPATVEYFNDYAFKDFYYGYKGGIAWTEFPADLTIYAPKGSFAEDWAVRNGVNYIECDKMPVEDVTMETAASGKCKGFFWSEEDDTEVYWNYENGVLTISGTGEMQDFYYTYGGRDQTTVQHGKPWEEYYDKIEKLVVKEGVASISRMAFVECKNLKEVEIADNVNVGHAAFLGVDSLQKVTLGKNCYLSQESFSNCRTLQEITLPEGTEVYNRAFTACENLKTVNFEGSGISIHYSAFDETSFYEKTDLIYVNNELLWIKNAKELTSYTVPDGTIRIGGYLFSGGKLTEIKLPDSLKVIGPDAFCECDFTEVILPEGLKRIEERAFAYCYYLTTAPLPESLEFLGNSAFRNTHLSSVTIRKNLVVGEDADLYSYDGAFYNCEWLTQVTIEEGVEKIANGMFAGCKSLGNISIPDSIKVIGNSAFRDCYNLPRLPIGENTAHIGAYAFQSCSIKEADLKNVTTIGTAAFNDCNLYKVVLNENLTKIPDSIFFACENLSEINIPQSITAIGNDAFRGAVALTGELVVPKGVTYIGERAFTGCSFDKIVLPEGLTEIGDYAFKDCKNITHITVPDSVARIGEGAFAGCESLNKINLGENVTELKGYAFSRCGKLENVTIPKGVSVIGEGLFNECTSLKNVTLMAEEITAVGAEAFLGCVNLNEIHMPDTVTEVGANAFANSGIYNNPTYWDGDVMYIANCVVAVKGGGECVKIKEGTRAIAEEAFRDKAISEVCVPGSIKTIGYHAFYRSRVKKIVLTEGVETIGYSAISWCYVEEVELPDSLLLIEDSAFSGCYEIKELVIPCRVQIEENAFESYNGKLEKVTFKEGREELYMPRAFGYMTNIKEVTLPEGLKKIGNMTFYNWQSLEKINFPHSLEEIGENAFYGCDRLTSIEIPNVKTIGEEAFKNCDRLETVTLGENVTVGKDAFSECPILINPLK